jgi:cysteine synthase A
MSWVPSPSTARHLFYGILIGFSLSFTSTSVISAYRRRRGDNATPKSNLRPIELRSDEILDGVTGLIGAWFSGVARDLGLTDPSGHLGNTPLVRINSLSNALGVEILGKAEVRTDR